LLFLDQKVGEGAEWPNNVDDSERTDVWNDSDVWQRFLDSFALVRFSADF
jgi:hypothetical protein